MIYTSYFGNYKHFGNLTPIGITRYPPVGFKGLNLKELAPSEQLLKQYKNNQIDNYVFEKKYIEELENQGLDPIAVKEKIGDNVVLCCYEKPGDFCHRHILIKWLGEG